VAAERLPPFGRFEIPWVAFSVAATVNSKLNAGQLFVARLELEREPTVRAPWFNSSVPVVQCFTSSSAPALQVSQWLLLDPSRGISSRPTDRRDA